MSAFLCRCQARKEDKHYAEGVDDAHLGVAGKDANGFERGISSLQLCTQVTSRNSKYIGVKIKAHLPRRSSSLFHMLLLCRYLTGGMGQDKENVDC